MTFNRIDDSSTAGAASWKPLTAFLALVLCGGSGQAQTHGSAAKQNASAGAPAVEQQFCDRFKAAYDEYDRLMKTRDNERNPLRKEDDQKQIDGIQERFWNDQYAIIGPSGEFKDWRGGLGFQRHEGDKLKLDVFFVPCLAFPQGGSLSMATGQFIFRESGNESYQNMDTNPLLSSPVGQALANYDTSKYPVVSGSFIWGRKDMQRRGRPMADNLHFVAGGDSGVSIYWRGAGLSVMVRFTSITTTR